MTQKIILKLNHIEKTLLEFLDDESSGNETFLNLINFFENQQVQKDYKEFKMILHLISILSIEHHRTAHFISKIEQILNQYKNIIQQNFSNIEIFNIFKRSKRVLLFLFKEGILIPDKTLYSLISTKDEYKSFEYLRFFAPEFNSFLKQEIDDDQFNQKRLIGENDSYICQLIRKDSVEEFITFINQNNYSLLSTINNSIFETNSFLIGKDISLIEYAAFFGAIQIFRYLYMNKNELLSPSLWIYAIHSRNAELIHLLEEIQIEPKDKSFKKCLFESIKCHHNEISDYIDNNLLQKSQNESSFDSILKCLEYFNFCYLNNYDNFEEQIVNEPNLFYYLCKFDYYPIVKLLLLDKPKDLKSVIICF